MREGSETAVNELHSTGKNIEFVTNKLVALQICCINFMPLGRPNIPPIGDITVTRPDRFKEVFTRMERSARRFVKLSGGDLSPLGRGRRKLSNALLEVNRKDYSVLPHSSTITKTSTTTSEADINKVALPKHAGQVDAGKFLKLVLIPIELEFSKTLGASNDLLTFGLRPAFVPVIGLAPIRRSA